MRMMSLLQKWFDIQKMMACYSNEVLHAGETLLPFLLRWVLGYAYDVIIIKVAPSRVSRPNICVKQSAVENEWDLLIWFGLHGWKE